MAVYQTQIEGKVFESIQASLASLGYEIVRVKINQSSSKILQIMIERNDGQEITVEDCEKASRQVSVILDVEDIISDQYNLEMSSAGLNRPLTRLKDFHNHVNSLVKLTSIQPINGRKRFSGYITEVVDNIITINLKGEDYSLQIDFDNIAEATLQYFDSK